jgi:hypothetical protein
MISQDEFCSNCQCYHYPDRRYEDDCGQPFVPVPRAPQPTSEQQHAWAMREIEWRMAQENRQRRQEEERLERAKAWERAKVGDMFEDVHRRKAAVLDEKSAEVHAQQAEARAWRKVQVQSRRQEQRLAAREREQRAKDHERAQKLTESIVASERRTKERCTP